MRVVGLDLSITATGICTADGQTLTVRTDKRPAGDERLLVIRDALLRVLLGADLAVVEDLPTHAHGAGTTGMVQGVARVALLDCAVPYALVPAASLKKFATGRGSATKPDLRVALLKRTGTDLRDDNQVDAWWLRSMGCAWLGEPVLTLPADQLDALAKITWPEALRSLLPSTRTLGGRTLPDRPSAPRRERLGLREEPLSGGDVTKRGGQARQLTAEQLPAAPAGTGVWTQPGRKLILHDVDHELANDMATPDAEAAP